MECPSLLTLGYEAFSAQLHERVRRDRIPINGSFEITLRCNLRCEHCYIPFSQRRAPVKSELSLSEFERIFGELADAGTLWLLLTGGEPLLRQDFQEIYRTARKTGFILTLFTNGTLLDERTADFLAEYPPFTTEISLYGATQATYEAVTGIPGSYARCRRGIELLQARGLPLKLKSVLMTINQHELPAMQQLAQELGLKFGFDPVLNAGIDGSDYPLQYRLSPEQILQVEALDPDRAREWPKQYRDLKERSVDPSHIYICGAGKTSFHIDAFGKLCMCISARTPNYDLRQGSFRQGWDEFVKGMLALEYSPTFSCAGCELRAICPQCPALGLSELGDMEGRVPFICELAHLRQQTFDPPLVKKL